MQNILSKLFGGAGYMAWLLQYLVLAALYFERFYYSSAGKVIFPTSGDGQNIRPQPVVIPSITLPTSGIFTSVMLLLGVALIGLVIYIVVVRYIPAVNTTATKVVQEAAEHTVIQIERVGQKRITPRNRQLLTARVVWWLKLIISISPLIIVLSVVGTPLIPKEVAVIVMGTLSLWAVICFTIQISLAQVRRKGVQLGT